MVCIIATNGSLLNVLWRPYRDAGFSAEICSALQATVDELWVPVHSSGSRPRPRLYSPDKELPLTVVGHPIPRSNTFLSKDRQSRSNKEKAPRNGGAEVYGDMKKDPTGQGPNPQRLSQVPVWIATKA